jgi:TonB family protein
MKKWNQVVLGLLLAVPAFGQTGSSGTVLAAPILQGAALPMYPPIARAAHITGQVIVRVTVKNGKVAKTDILSKSGVASGQRYLETPTVENLKTWRFAADVTGAFTVTYTYEISGEPTDDPTNARVEMLPSLEVKVTGRPLKPTCNDCGAPPSVVLPRRATGADVRH